MENNPILPHQPTAFASQNQATPLNTRAASIHVSFPCTSTHVYRGSRTVTMARELEDHIVGPMALKDFVEKFLSLSSNEKGVTVGKTKLKRMKNKMRELDQCKRELEMYTPLIDAIQPLCPKYIPYDTHAKPLRNFDEMNVKPDICFYSAKHVKARTMGISAVEMIAEVKYNLNDDAFVRMDALKPIERWSPDPPPPPTTPTKPDMAMLTETTLLANDDSQDQQSVEEIEESDEDQDQDDGDGDSNNENKTPDPKQFEADIRRLSSQGRDTLGQITTYTVAQKAAQFRKHIFSLLMFKGYARILFWDWSGVVVTDRFPLTDDYFAEFFHRYNKASGAQRGHDETIGVLNAKERAAVSNLNLFNEDARLVKIPVGQGDKDKETFYVVEQPYFMGGLSPFGRSTRGFIAYSLQEILQHKSSKLPPKKLFLKDTWRIVGRPYEHTFYDHLHAAKVSYVATYRQTSDVPNQETIIQQIYKEASGALGSPKKVRSFHHYRMVLEQVGSDLSTFSSTKELVSVFHQALKAHREAYDAGVLHRDISVGNIMFGEADKNGNRPALLVDWDMAKFTNDNITGTIERTGTWQYLAARLLRKPQDNLPANFDDDLESFVYVLTWMIFRYTDVDFSPVELYSTIQEIFNESYLNEEGKETGGRGKLRYLRGPGVLEEAKIKNRILAQLLQDIKDIIATRYPNEWSLPSMSQIPQFSNQVQMERKKLLETPGWMTTLFGNVLESEHLQWPENDAAKLNPMEEPSHDSYKKNISTIANIVANNDTSERHPKRLKIG